MIRIPRFEPLWLATPGSAAVLVLFLILFRESIRTTSGASAPQSFDLPWQRTRRRPWRSLARRGLEGSPGDQRGERPYRLFEPGKVQGGAVSGPTGANTATRGRTGREVAAARADPLRHGWKVWQESGAGSLQAGRQRSDPVLGHFRRAAEEHQGAARPHPAPRAPASRLPEGRQKPGREELSCRRSKCPATRGRVGSRSRPWGP
jgi:hypothetical protein